MDIEKLVNKYVEVKSKEWNKVIVIDDYVFFGDYIDLYAQSNGVNSHYKIPMWYLESLV